MILWINNKEAKGKYIVINEKKEEAYFSKELFIDFIETWLNKIKNGLIK